MSQARSSSALELLRVVLTISGALALVGGFIGGIATVSIAGASGSTSMGSAVFNALGIILAGILVAALLWALTTIVSLLAVHLHKIEQMQIAQDDVRAILGRLEQSLNASVPAGASPARAARDGLSSSTSADAPPLDFLEELRDLHLMNSDQRQRIAARHWVVRREAMTELIERDVLLGHWANGFRRLEELELLLPDDAAVKELRLSVEAEQTTRMEEDLRSTRSQLQPLIASASWNQAHALAEALQAKYAAKPQASQLAEELRLQHEAFDHENAERLFKETAHATEKHQWRLAIQTLEEFLRRYPADKRADALRLDLPTLQENAAAQERKEQEELFKDLLKHQRYDQAITVARGVLHKYPTSSAATELTKLLPRVEELAKQEAAKVPVPAA